MVFDLVRRSCKVVPQELVIKEGAVDLRCLMNCLRVNLLEFSSFCLPLSMTLLLCQRQGRSQGGQGGGGGGGGMTPGVRNLSPSVEKEKGSIPTTKFVTHVQ